MLDLHSALIPALAWSISLQPALASTIDIDFDSIPGMVNSPGSSVPAASRLGSQLAGTLGVSFSSLGGFVAVVHHAPGLTVSMPNVIGGTGAAGQLSYTAPITISFFDPASPGSMATTDFVRIRGDMVAIPGTATMKAYDLGGSLIASSTVADVAGGLTLAISMPGIHSVQLTETSGTIGFDNLSFDPVVPCGPLTSYCTAGTTSHGCLATMAGTGTPSASLSSGFQISALTVEGQTQGLIFYGLSGASGFPWVGASTSFLCVKSPKQRTFTQSSGGTLAQCNGTLTLDWNAYVASTPGALGTPFAGGEVVWAQGWFRDPAAPGTTNLSNGLQFSVCP